MIDQSQLIEQYSNVQYLVKSLGTVGALIVYPELTRYT